jgi:peptidoglycan/LPS O-acetylase OafA/YrhL
MLRIVPAFWVVFTVVVLCVGPMGDSIGDLVAAYGFAQNFDGGGVARVMGQAWTLDVEVAFYLLVPAWAAVMCYLSRRWSRSARTRAFFLGLAVIGVVSLVLRSSRPDAFTWVTSLPAMLFAFIPGLLLAGVEHAGGPAWFRRSRGQGYAAAMLAAGGGLLVFYCVRAAPEVPQYLGGVNAILVAGGAGLVVAALLTYQWATGSCYRAIDNRVMRWVGERSYSVYLVHQPMIAATIVGWQRIIANPAERLILSAPVTAATILAASAVCYRYVERPFLRLRPLPRRPFGLGKPSSGQEAVVAGASPLAETPPR